jgi:hypothetical protein
MKLASLSACLPGILLAAAVGLSTARTATAADAPTTAPATAVKAVDFLNSIGVCVHVQHHQSAAQLAEPLKYTGVRVIRDGADGNYDLSGLLLLHKETGVLVCFGPGSGARDESLPKSLAACKELAAAGALLAIEGPNEPNNFGGVTYQGQNSTKLKSWLPVANYQKDLYAAVKSDPDLKGYPVLGVSEAGAQDNNCGLHYLTIPTGAGTLMPDGTRFSDFINCHNYACGHIKGQIDNQVTLAAAVHPQAAIDHLYGNHGKTWRKKFPGYSEEALATIPKVTTETGWKTNKTPAGDIAQGKIFLNLFLAQYKAGWKHTFIYEFADDSDGAFGLIKSDLTTLRPAAHYLHNFTTILADTGAVATPGTLPYSIPDQPQTVHDLLLQKSDGTFELAVWGEQVKGSHDITLNLGASHASVTVYDPTTGTAPTQTLANVSSVPLTLSDHVLIVELPR